MLRRQRHGWAGCRSAGANHEGYRLQHRPDIQRLLHCDPGTRSYDLMASLIAPYGSQAALAAARDLDAKIESLLETAAR